MGDEIRKHGAMFTHQDFDAMWTTRLEGALATQRLRDEVCYRLELGTIALVPAKKVVWGPHPRRTRDIVNHAIGEALEVGVKYRKIDDRFFQRRDGSAAAGSSEAGAASSVTDVTSNIYGALPGTASPVQAALAPKERRSD